jgi:hypothetical protein
MLTGSLLQALTPFDEGDLVVIVGIAFVQEIRYTGLH